MKLLKYVSIIVLVFAFKANADRIVRIAVIDKDYVFSSALSIKNIKNHMELKELELQKIFSERKEELNRIGDNLNKQKDILNSDVFNKKIDDLNKLAMSFQKEISDKKLALEDSYSNYLNIIYSKLKEISKKIANENGFSLVLFLSGNENIFYSNIDIDISGKVVDILNKELPNVIQK